MMIHGVHIGDSKLGRLAYQEVSQGIVCKTAVERIDTVAIETCLETVTDVNGLGAQLECVTACGVSQGLGKLPLVRVGRPGHSGFQLKIAIDIQGWQEGNGVRLPIAAQVCE